MSQRSQEFSSSFPYSDLYNSDIAQELSMHVGSQDLTAILNEADFNSPYANDALYDHDATLHDETTVSFEDIKVQMPPQLRPLPSTEVLSNEEYVGPYSFDVSVLPVYKSKNPWVYSPKLNKVFMDIDQPFPVDFKVASRPNKALFIRTTPQYSAQHHAGDTVFRCIQHDHAADPTNKDTAEHVRQHVIRCSNPSSEYLGDSKDGQRLSIVFPLSLPQAGSDSVRELYRFVCKSSCPAPGMNRRGIEVIFTLEDESGTVLGRNCLKVRICACPKRDKEKEENESGNGPPRGKKRKAANPPPAHPGKVIPTSDDFKMFNLNLSFPGKQNLLHILTCAENTYMSKVLQYQGTPEEQVFKKTVVDIQGMKRQLQ